jgi:hypothetical protein
MKKVLLIGLVAIGVALAGVSHSQAGVAVGVNVGFPVGYCGYPYPYGYPYSYPYVYPAAYPAPVFGSFSFFSGPRFFGPRVVVVRRPVVIVRHRHR